MRYGNAGFRAMMRLRQLAMFDVALSVRRVDQWSIAIPRSGNMPPQYVNLMTGQVGIVRPAGS